MKISLNWLRNYIELSGTADSIADRLTNTGLEVEGVTEIQSVAGGLEGIVLGEVIEKIKHPNADKLSLTKVNVGNSEPLSIVCGAPNVQAGQKVVVATVGTTIYPSTGEPFKIKKSKIRGEVSEGMICAEDEIGLGKSHDGIMVLENGAKPGTLASEYFNIETDKVFEIGLTPNRTDAMSHIGVARDLKASYCLEEKLDLKIPDLSAFAVEKNQSPTGVLVDDPNDCIRYSGLTLKDVNVAESPDWLRNKLLAIGLKPINNVVDITNYVLFETGQPLHAFDQDKIAGNKVIIRRANQGEKFQTLDEVERKLNVEDLMICDAEKPMCIAGVFGGLNSGVTDSTTTVFLESACFDPVLIRGTAKRHGLQTDASFRFERGTDPAATIYALKRAALLMKEIAGAKISGEIVDSYKKPREEYKVSLGFNNVTKLIGESIDTQTIKLILESLDIKILAQSDKGMDLSIPLYRVDVHREADVIEEILRIYGYNKIMIPEHMKMSEPFIEKRSLETLYENLSG
ncbi:MAG: phenylalanine--tRNA ligase subunit beta, partial [Bacteroidia bacterium]|nr:phenylalanine--tRNA ligase subunit beta [Bacteroidia bacterium]